jgi:hypothetical protein
MSEEAVETVVVTGQTNAGAEAPKSAATPTEAAAEGQQPQAEAAPTEGAPTTEAPATGETSTEPSPQVVNIEPPSGFEQFAPQFTAYNEAAQAFLKANPNATAAEAFAAAAEFQIQQVSGQAQQHLDQAATWLAEAEADPEIGGKNWDGSIARAQKALSAWGSPELFQQLDATGLGNNPAVIRFLAKAGKALTEAPVEAPAGEGSRTSFANSLYPD